MSTTPTTRLPTPESSIADWVVPTIVHHRGPKQGAFQNVFLARVDILTLAVLTGLGDVFLHATTAATKLSIGVVHIVLYPVWSGSTPTIYLRESGLHAARSLKSLGAAFVVPIPALFRPEFAVTTHRWLSLAPQPKFLFRGIGQRIGGIFNKAWKSPYRNRVVLASAVTVSGAVGLAYLSITLPGGLLSKPIQSAATNSTPTAPVLKPIFEVSTTAASGATLSDAPQNATQIFGPVPVVELPQAHPFCPADSLFSEWSLYSNQNIPEAGTPAIPNPLVSGTDAMRIPQESGTNWTMYGGGLALIFGSIAYYHRNKLQNAWKSLTTKGTTASKDSSGAAANKSKAHAHIQTTTSAGAPQKAEEPSSTISPVASEKPPADSDKPTVVKVDVSPATPTPSTAPTAEDSSKSQESRPASTPVVAETSKPAEADTPKPRAPSPVRTPAKVETVTTDTVPKQPEKPKEVASQPTPTTQPAVPAQPSPGPVVQTTPQPVKSRPAASPHQAAPTNAADPFAALFAQLMPISPAGTAPGQPQRELTGREQEIRENQKAATPFLAQLYGGHRVPNYMQYMARAQKQDPKTAAANANNLAIVDREAAAAKKTAHAKKATAAAPESTN